MFKCHYVRACQCVRVLSCHMSVSVCACVVISECHLSCQCVRVIIVHCVPGLILHSAPFAMVLNTDSACTSCEYIVHNGVSNKHV